MVAIVLLQEGVGKEPATWRFELKNSSGHKEESGSLHTPRLTERQEEQGGGGGGGREEIERKKDGQESESPSWCRAPHGALLTHIQRFESPEPAWVTLKQIPAWHSALSSRSREIHQGKVTPYSQSNSGSLTLPQTRYWALSSPFPSSEA